ncbi:VWA domain-containing protein [Leptobacterium sp. I13]|uniref:VWA domain-containing protein n=1 Tax=Leptobacterium meishanense TaxID=3128904 RepID=UPI0030EE4D9E
MKFCQSSIVIISLFFFSNMITAQLSEAEVRTQINEAQKQVNQAQQALRTAELQLQQKGNAVKTLQDEWNTTSALLDNQQKRLASVENSMQESVNHLNEEIAKWERRVEAAKRDNKPSDEIENAERHLMAYRNMKNRRLSRSPLAQMKTAIENEIARLEGVLNQKKQPLENAIAEAKAAEENVHQTNLNLSDAQKKLHELQEKAPELLGHIAPPYLQEVIVKSPGGSVKYKAHWEDYGFVIDKQIELVKKGIEVQEEHLETITKLINEISDDLLIQNRVATEKMDAYVAEVQGWGIIKSMVPDLLDATLNIARNFKEMGPYAVFYEAGWRLFDLGKWALSDTPNNANWDVTKLPTTPNPPADISGTAWNYASSIGKDQLKSTVMQALQAYISADYGIAGEALNYTHNIDYEPSLKSLKGIKDFKSNFRDIINKGQFWVIAEKDQVGKWMTTVSDPGNVKMRDFYKKLARNPKNFVESLKGSFNKERLKGALVDLAQSTALQALKDYLDGDRIELWMEYLEADMKRSTLHNALKSAGNKRRKQQEMLKALNEVLQELIQQKEKESEKPTRYIVVDENDELRGKGNFSMELNFTADIEVQEITLGAKTITGTATDKEWKGSFDLVDIGEDIEVAQLTVKALGKTSRKQLDDPITNAKYMGTRKTWSGYEAKPDTYHKIKLKPLKEGNSIVLLVDCSGSMNENARMQRAIAAGQKVLTDTEFKANDEIALMAFYDCGSISLNQPFTSDIELVKQKLSQLSARSGTPLGTAIQQAGIYMNSAATTDNRRLIVLTDGIESCGGNEFITSEAVNNLNAEYEKKVFN